MKKICPFLISLLLTLSVSAVFAADLSLTNIGALATSGKTYSEWWYTGTLPLLKGTAESSSDVTVTINDEQFSTSADDSGAWSFYSEKLIEGEHSVSIGSGDQTYSFTLHLGQGLPSDLGATSETTQSTVVPATGTGQLVALVAGISAIVLGWYFYSSKKAFVID